MNDREIASTILALQLTITLTLGCPERFTQFIPKLDAILDEIHSRHPGNCDGTHSPKEECSQ